MTTLHLLTSNESFDRLTEQAFLVGPDDAVVLMAEGVYSGFASQNLHRPVYVIQSDLILRGLNPQNISGKLIDYNDLIKLLGQFSRSISW